MLGTGSTAPLFVLPGTDGDTITQYRLTDYTDAGATLLLFYPFAFSPVCTEQLCGFRDAEWLTVTENVDVFGISVDSAYAQRRFSQTYDFQFPLLSDRLASVAADYGVRDDELETHPAVAKRAVFAIDDTRTIRYTWGTDDAYESPDIEALEESIAWLREPEETPDTSPQDP